MLDDPPNYHLIRGKFHFLVLSVAGEMAPFPVGYVDMNMHKYGPGPWFLRVGRRGRDAQTQKGQEEEKKEEME